MENLRLNETIEGCSVSMGAIHVVLNAILLFVSFPATFAVIVILLLRTCKAKSCSSAELFLLQINFANVCLFVFNLMFFLAVVYVHDIPETVHVMFFSPTLTARPVFILTICVIFYLAIAHPVTYLTVKTRRHWEWVVITLGWLYALLVNALVIVYNIDIFQLVYVALFYTAILPSMFFNVATLRALSSSGHGNSGQPLNPAKKKAFRIILSILLTLILYYVPRMTYLIYPIAPMDDFRLKCSEGSAILFLPKISEIAMPVIFLYSLRKLGVSSRRDLTTSVCLRRQGIVDL